MGLSIADIDSWNPESIRAVAVASEARAAAASQASARLKDLSAFKSWQGSGADAAQARTHGLAEGVDEHGQSVSRVAKAANVAAGEVRQVKSQLDQLRSTLGQYGIIVDAAGSRVVPPTNMSSLPPAHRNLVQKMAVIGQQSLDRIRLAADLTDAHLTRAIKPNGDEFELDTQYTSVRGGPAGGLPEGITASGTDCINATLTVIQITIATYTIHGGGGSNGKHCK